MWRGHISRVNRLVKDYQKLSAAGAAVDGLEPLLAAQAALATPTPSGAQAAPDTTITPVPEPLAAPVAVDKRRAPERWVKQRVDGKWEIVTPQRAGGLRHRGKYKSLETALKVLQQHNRQKLMEARRARKKSRDMKRKQKTEAQVALAIKRAEAKVAELEASKQRGIAEGKRLNEVNEGRRERRRAKRLQKAIPAAHSGARAMVSVA